MSVTYSTSDLADVLTEKMKMSTARVRLKFISDYVGGQPSSPEGVRAFAEHHLCLAGAELDAAVARILGEEAQAVKTTSGGTDEVEEKESYGLNVIRRNADGLPWIGTWQVRAMLKQSASRLGIFQAKGKVGSKGDMSEAMMVKPIGISAGGGVQQIMIARDGKPYSTREYRKFMGSVGTPKGRMSIVHDSEIAPAGCEIEFVIEWPSGRVKAKDMAAIIALAQRVGLGSVKAMESGRFDATVTIEEGTGEEKVEA